MQTQLCDSGKVPVSYTASVFTPQRRQPQTSLVNRQHWHRPEPHLSQEHTLLSHILVPPPRPPPQKKKSDNIREAARVLSAFFLAPVSPLLNIFALVLISAIPDIPQHSKINTMNMIQSNAPVRLRPNGERLTNHSYLVWCSLSFPQCSAVWCQGEIQ